MSALCRDIATGMPQFLALLRSHFNDDFSALVSARAGEHFVCRNRLRPDSRNSLPNSSVVQLTSIGQRCVRISSSSS